MNAVDWSQIKTEYEHGDSSRVLSARHKVPFTTILSRAKVGKWQRSFSFTPPFVNETNNEPNEDTPTEPAPIAKKALRQLAALLKNETPLDLKEHKLFSDSLSQYYKVIALAAPTDQQIADTRPNYSHYTHEQLDRLLAAQAIIDAITREAEAEHDEKIVPIRRQG